MISYREDTHAISSGSAATGAAGAEGSASGSTRPHAPWDPAGRIVRAVLLGDEAWERGAGNYMPPECNCSSRVSSSSCGGGGGGEAPIGRPDTLPPGSILTRASSSCSVCEFTRLSSLPESTRADALAALMMQRGATGIPRGAELRLTQFVQRWRRNFLSFVKPRAMPKNWAVAFPVLQTGMNMRKKGMHEGALFIEVKRVWEQQGFSS